MVFLAIAKEAVRGLIVTYVQNGMMASVKQILSKVDANYQEHCRKLQELTDQFIQEGHSENCARTNALAHMDLLDGDVPNVVRMTGGCSKCGF